MTLRGKKTQNVPALNVVLSHPLPNFMLSNFNVSVIVFQLDSAKANLKTEQQRLEMKWLKTTVKQNLYVFIIKE